MGTYKTKGQVIKSVTSAIREVRIAIQVAETVQMSDKEKYVFMKSKMKVVEQLLSNVI